MRRALVVTILIILLLIGGVFIYNAIVSKSLEVVYTPRNDAVQQGERLLIKQKEGGQRIVYEIPYHSTFYTNESSIGFIRLGNFRVGRNSVFFDTVLEVGELSGTSVVPTGEIKVVKKYIYNTRSKNLQELTG